VLGVDVDAEPGNLAEIAPGGAPWRQSTRTIRAVHPPARVMLYACITMIASPDWIV